MHGVCKAGGVTGWSKTGVGRVAWELGEADKA